ncbi:hypothetical protein [Geoanaerobacter pelophilus]|uniref:hypothetical protein n=1 Tax=Geoanaerobacter pelophilus TaxID=60036 RepID=UPI000A26BF60|nr:hypothetical protein [Geoanaerobacter pelophilus]
MNQQNIIGIPWYDRKNYQALLSIFTDRNNFPSAFDAWEERANKHIKQQQQEGVINYRVVIRPTEILAYCEALGLEINSQARIRYVNEILQERLDRGEIALR